MTTLQSELSTVLALAEKATPGEWAAMPRFPDFIVPASHADRKIGWTSIDSAKHEYATVILQDRREKAQPDLALAIAAVNFLRTNGPALSSLAARVEGAERDAARYKWLRAGATSRCPETSKDDQGGDWISVTSGLTYDMPGDITGGDLDAAIDAARADAGGG